MSEHIPPVTDHALYRYLRVRGIDFSFCPPEWTEASCIVCGCKLLRMTVAQAREEMQPPRLARWVSTGLTAINVGDWTLVVERGAVVTCLGAGMKKPARPRMDVLLRPRPTS
jgi:hypothetical protein